MEIPRHWRLRKERLRMEMGYSCNMCGRVFTQDRPVCPECGLNFESGQFIGEAGKQFVAEMCQALLDCIVVEGATAAHEVYEIMSLAGMGNTDRLVEVLFAFQFYGVNQLATT